MASRLNSGLGTLKSLIFAIPLGTSTIIIISLFLMVINAFTAWNATASLCLASTNTTQSLFTHFPSLFGNQLVHSGLWHEVVATLIFPFAASGIEQQVGTFQFLALFCLGGFITSFFYVISMFFFSFIFPSWGLFCVNGLDIPFFMFLTIEGLNGRGLFEITSRFGLNIPRELYFMPFFVLLAVTRL
jgi:membrane associated rhomboid family serine protease